MSEPTIEELIQFAEEADNSKDLRYSKAIRAILEQHRELYWRKTSEELPTVPEGEIITVFGIDPTLTPMSYDYRSDVGWRYHDAPQYWIPLPKLPLPPQSERCR